MFSRCGYKKRGGLSAAPFFVYRGDALFLVVVSRHVYGVLFGFFRCRRFPHHLASDVCYTQPAEQGIVLIADFVEPSFGEIRARLFRCRLPGGIREVLRHRFGLSVRERTGFPFADELGFEESDFFAQQGLGLVATLTLLVDGLPREPQRDMHHVFDIGPKLPFEFLTKAVGRLPNVSYALRFHGLFQSSTLA